MNIIIENPVPSVSRNGEIVTQFKQVLDAHMNDFMSGNVDKMYELKDLAAIISLHPVYMSKVIKLETGHHACYFYEQRILQEAKQLLADRTQTIKMIAHRLDYDVSNFTKFFKRFMDITPSAYRKTIWAL
jgi:AraC-like DNA-binding protein